MRIDLISAVPSLLESPFSHSILKRAIQNNLVEVNVINLRDYATGKQKQIDDYAFGGANIDTQARFQKQCGYTSLTFALLKKSKKDLEALSP